MSTPLTFLGLENNSKHDVHGSVEVGLLSLGVVQSAVSHMKIVVDLKEE
jgi:hypothetical protein